MGSLDELKAMKEQYETRIKSEGKDILRREFAAMFDAHPTVKAVRWRQYTPYFNDGDECIFSVHGPSMRLEESTARDGEEEDGYLNEYDNYVRKFVDGKFIGGPGKERYDAVNALVTGIPEDLMKAVFGDHAEITATRDGFEVEEYEHD